MNQIIVGVGQEELASKGWLSNLSLGS